MLNNPYEIWKDLRTVKQPFFYFIFEDHLVYYRNEGYRTTEELSSTRLFENFVIQTTKYVLPPGLEPGTTDPKSVMISISPQEQAKAKQPAP